MSPHIEWKFLTLCAMLAVSMHPVASMHLISAEIFTLQTKIESNDFLTEFIPKINTIQQGFNQLLIHYSKPDADANFNPFYHVEICVLSKAEQKELLRIVLETMGEDDPPITVVEKSACPEFDKLKIEILMLKRDFMEMLNNKANSPAYEKLKVHSEEKHRTLQKKINDELRKDLHAEHNRVNELLKELEEKQKIIDNKSVQVCISELKRNNVQNAIDSYRNVTDIRKIKEIIHSSYENADSFQGLYDFIEKTLDPVSSLYGLTALFDEMQSANHKDPWYIFQLAESASRNHDNNGSEFESLMKSTDDELARILRSGVERSDFYGILHILYSMIKRGDYSEIIRELMMKCEEE